MLRSTGWSTRWPPCPTGSTTKPCVCRVRSAPRITAEARLAERGLVLTPLCRPRLTKRRCEGALSVKAAWPEVAAGASVAAGAAAGLTRCGGTPSSWSPSSYAMSRRPSARTAATAPAYQGALPPWRAITRAPAASGAAAAAAPAAEAGGGTAAGAVAAASSKSESGSTANWRKVPSSSSGLK